MLLGRLYRLFLRTLPRIGRWYSGSPRYRNFLRSLVAFGSLRRHGRRCSMFRFLRFGVLLADAQLAFEFFHAGGAETFDLREIVNAAERPVDLAILDDGVRLAWTDTFYRLQLL